MIEPILSLAFSVYHNAGVYVLLIGSGVSRSAGIPTGWEIVLDLLRKLAYIQGENCEPDPSVWYREKYGEDPDYAKLLEAIAKSPGERSQLLRGYFEPSEEEREQGIKVPTEAHKALAKMVADGFIRVIVTTNFDRLIEKALEDEGVNPTIISTPDAAEGAIPLTHAKCTIIKVHGDYLDTRIKNTPQELSSYDERMDRLLDRVFDEFGLIICGWSAEWDVALCAALERCKSHRFTTYWTIRGEPRDKAQKLIDLRRAQVIPIVDANTFFREVAEKVFALKDISKPHPLSAKVAVASLKKYIVDESQKICLHDLVMNETERLQGELSDKNFPVQHVNFSREELLRRIQRYEALTEILLALMINGCYWGEKQHEGLWVKCLERIANPVGRRDGLIAWLNLGLYPALLLLYGGGIASIVAERYETFSALLTKASVRDGSRERPLATTLHTRAVMEPDVARELPGMERRYTPLSDYLFKFLRNSLRDFLPGDMHYQKGFDRFEYLLALIHVDLKEKLTGRIWGPTGCFGWRYSSYPEDSIMKEVEKEADLAGDRWPLLELGHFEGTIGRFKHIKSQFDGLVSQLGWW
jgi:hypothetical protein